MFDFFEFFLTLTSSFTLLTIFTLILFYKFKKDNELPMRFPKVTVFVPYYNEDSSALLKSLSFLDSQSYPHELEVFLIDDGSTNNTTIEVEKWLRTERKQKYKLIRKPYNNGRKGIALDYALNLNLATGEVYVVVDSDTFIESDGIKELVGKLWSDERYAAVCGYITPNNYYESFIGLLQHYEHVSFYGAIRAAQDKIGCVPVLAGAFVAHRASVVKELGGWSEWLVEDIAWCWKAISHKYKTGYAPRAKASTQCPINVKDLFKQRRRWARGRVEAYAVAWKAHWLSGVCSTPWFIITAVRYIFPSSIMLLLFMIIFDIWIPVFISCSSMILYLSLINSYVSDYDLKKDISIGYVLKAPVFYIMLEIITWLPNLFGYADEIFGRKKLWLTR